MKKNNNTIMMRMDAAQVLYYLEGCARGSHLRQGCWRDMIDLYPKMSQKMRNFIYTYAKRDIAPIFEMTYNDGLHPCGAEDFFQFLACFDKDNRYMVIAKEENKEEWINAYLYNDKYYDGKFFIDEEYITSIEKL